MMTDTTLRGFTIEVENSTTDPSGGTMTTIAIVPNHFHGTRMMDEDGNPLDYIRFTVYCPGGNN